VMDMLKGIGAAPGIAIGNAVIWAGEKYPRPEQSAGSPQEELDRFISAVDETRRQLEDVADKVAGRLGENEAGIFKAQLLVLNDPMLVNLIRENIGSGFTAVVAVERAVALLAEKFQALNDPYLQERAADIKDVGKRLIQNLPGAGPEKARIPEAGIIFAADLTPSETSLLDPEKVLGLVTGEGGKTSHTAILARALNIPAVVGVADVLEHVRDGDPVIVDGQNGEVIIRPDVQTLELYRRRSAQEKGRREKLNADKDAPAVTQDGYRVEVAANICGSGEIRAALLNGAEGVGLFRTEFLFLNRDGLPSEEEQFAVYKEVLSQMAPRRVIVRTLDIGGDKALPGLKLPAEQNPFLGLRGVRLCLQKEDLFYTQLRALLRASAFGNLSIMLPMISDLAEVEQTREIIARLERELPLAGGRKIPLGIMVETPAAAVMADQLAEVVDFFSIGTNDLVQYTMAVDRLNEQVAYLYQPLHPAVLRLLRGVIQAARRAGKWVGICGEMAADTLAVPLLVGMGVDELSMSSGSIPAVKKLIKNISKSDASALVEEALKLRSAGGIMELVECFIKERVSTDVCQDGEDPEQDGAARPAGHPVCGNGE